MNAVKDKGLRVSGLFGDHTVRNIKTYTRVSDVAYRDFDLVFISVKSFDTGTAIREVLPLLSPETLIISLQNGIGNIEAIGEIACAERTVGAKVHFGAEMVEPGHARVTVFGDKVMLGSLSPKAPVERIAAVAAMFSKAGIPTDTTDDINRFLWNKITFNCCLNAPSAILDCTYGALGKDPGTVDIMKKIIAEIYEVAKAEGVNPGFNSPAEYEAIFFGKLLPNTAGHRSSTLQDLKRGRKTEIDALNGVIARLGEKHGIETPVNLILTQLVHAREKLKTL